jgi:hypothetical protein
MTDLDGLRAIVSDLEAKVSRLQTPRSVSTPSIDQAPLEVPYWNVVMGSGLTLTPGADWEPLFDAKPLISEYRTTRIATAGGEINTFGTHHIATQRRFTIQWDASANGSVDCSITGWYDELSEPDGNVQVKLNGQFVTLSPSAQLFTLNYKEGRNKLVISMGVRPILMTFTGVLFDGKTSRWVNPRG